MGGAWNRRPETEWQPIETAMTNWNGYPPDPSRDGWHWLGFPGPHPAYWRATSGRWEHGGVMFGATCPPNYISGPEFNPRIRYLGECPIPDPVDGGRG